MHIQRTYIHIYLPTYAHTPAPTCVHTVGIRITLYVRTYVCTYACMNILTTLPTYVRTYVTTCIIIYIHTCSGLTNLQHRYTEMAKRMSLCNDYPSPYKLRNMYNKRTYSL